MEAYHITYKYNIYSILKNGLVPTIGHNSKSVGENHFLIYFTKKENIEEWIKRFNFDPDKIVILKFPCTNYGSRLDDCGDFFTSEKISPQDIKVVDEDMEYPLQTYYQDKKDDIDIQENKQINLLIKQVIDRLQKIKNVPLEKEDSWGYTEVDPDIFATMDLIKFLFSSNHQKEYQDSLLKIKEETLSRLLLIDLGISKDCVFYKELTNIFDIVLTSSNNLDLQTLDYFTMLICLNFEQRQIERFNRIDKKYYTNNNFSIDRFDLEELKGENSNINTLIEETINLRTNNLKK